ncbi:FimV/HubP family polar landmark protein [Polaromonas sp.]|uniref:FimV/HubP family polar landmark protein n=1 Tax=Polaromonas sp. TaxID=1869339 RepID=UPI002FCBD1F7
MKNPSRWRMGALAGAIALLGGFASLEAHALALGRVTVQSALGEPLRAEIDIPDINASEAASLKASIASVDAFKAAGLEYNSTVTNVQISLQRRPDGRSFLRLSSDRPVTEPFVDLVVEAKWASGSIVRDYTMLFDPPSMRQAGSAATMAAPTAPIVSRPAAPAPARVAAQPSYPTSPPSAVRPAPVEKTPGSGQQVTVKAGDTAGRIAAQNKPASVSLDQMLVALLRSNPDAFIGGNINRMKSGAVLDIPTAEQADAIAPGEASRTIVAQSKDFNEFRRKLAESAPTTQVASAGQQAGGKVQAKVEDRAPTPATPDKLTLSKGAVQGKAAAEEKIAQERQAKEAAARVAELSKNISDLNKLGSAPGTAATTAPAGKTPGIAVPAAAAPSIPVASPPTASTTAAAPASAPAAAVAPAATATAAASPASAAVATADPAAAAASASAMAAPQPAVAAAASAPAAPVKKAVLAPVPPPEPSLLDELTDNPLILPAAGGLLALLAGFGFYRYRQRRGTAQVDSSFLESRLQPDSFFGASGGQRIDTAEGNAATGSSMVYSPSQLDAAGDVDPVAEADVYLAYGRDLQAEEILKEAMRTSPMRVAIHAKLMEIYAKRRDAKAFEVVAVEAFNLTHGEGPEWAHISEMGRELDAANQMYQPGGHPAAGQGAVAGAAAFSATTQITQPVAAPAPSAVDFDLDLDFSVGDEAPVAAAPEPLATMPNPLQAIAPALAEPTQVASAAPAAAVAPAAPAAAPAAPMFEGLDMDFGSPAIAQPTAQAPAPAPDQAPSAEGLNFTVEPTPVAAAAKPAAAPAAAADSGMLEFDLGALSLDLNGPATESPALPASPAGTEDPLETKFALAEEFRAIGDMDGARSLAEEVLAQASGSLKGKAQAFVSALS